MILVKVVVASITWMGIGKKCEVIFPNLLLQLQAADSVDALLDVDQQTAEISCIIYAD